MKMMKKYFDRDKNKKFDNKKSEENRESKKYGSSGCGLQGKMI